MPVERHAGDAGRQAGAQRALPRDVAAGRALLQGRAHDHVVDLAAGDAGAAERGRDRVAAERLRRRVVEGAAIGLADRGAGGGDDDGFAHERLLSGQGDAHALGGCGEFECLRVCVLERNGARRGRRFPRSTRRSFPASVRLPAGRRPGVSSIWVTAKTPPPAPMMVREGAFSPTRNSTAGRHRFRRQQRGGLGRQQALGHACAAVGASTLTRMSYLAPSRCSTFISPTIAALAAP